MDQKKQDIEKLNRIQKLGHALSLLTEMRASNIKTEVNLIQKTETPSFFKNNSGKITERRVSEQVRFVAKV